MSLLVVTPFTALGQYAWDQGTAAMDHGFPFPDEHWEVEGPILDLDLPAEGAGGFNLALGDTNVLLAVGYEIYASEEDTLADVLILFIQDTMEISAGEYQVSPLEGTGSLFAWLPGISAELILGLVDTSFTLDSLAALNAYLALNGSITINQVNAELLDLDFEGSLVNTQLSFLSVSNGNFLCSSNLPQVEYPLGRYVQADDMLFWTVEGELNPLSGDEGVGAFSILEGDTLNYMILSYWPENDEGYTAHALVIRDLLADFATHDYLITPPAPGVPNAFSFETFPLTMLDLAALLSGDIGSDSMGFELLSVSGGPFQLNIDGETLTCEYGAEYADAWGGTLQLNESWDLGQEWHALSIEAVKLQGPEIPWLGASYPNPFNNSFRLPVQLDRPENIRVALVDLLGREQHVLLETQLPPGYHLLNLNVNSPDLASGWYGCRVTRSDGSFAVRSVLYLK